MTMKVPKTSTEGITQISIKLLNFCAMQVGISGGLQSQYTHHTPNYAKITDSHVIFDQHLKLCPSERRIITVILLQ